MVPLKNNNRLKPERVNIPMRYRIKGQNTLNDGNQEFLGPASPFQGSDPVNQNANDIYKQYLDSVRNNDYIKDDNEYMIAVERGSQSAESQSSAAIVHVPQQDINKINNVSTLIKFPFYVLIDFNSF